MATKNSVPQEHPTSRLAPPDPLGLPASVRQILSEETERFGAPLNTTTVWAHHPFLLTAYQGWRRAMNEVTRIPTGLNYLVYVRVASLSGCPF